MKKILLLFSLLALTGCASPKYYQWSSDNGKRCFYSCESQAWACRSGCGPSIPCNLACDRSAEFCRNACPDLKEVAEAPK